ncbi:hypothetical protein ABBQ38_010657 [Trebouxia sp. C0009 RCD-2024]
MFGSNGGCTTQVQDVLPSQLGSLSKGRTRMYRHQTTNIDVEGISTITSPALDMAALCLSSWPAAISTQMLALLSTISSLYHDSLRWQPVIVN